MKFCAHVGVGACNYKKPAIPGPLKLETFACFLVLMSDSDLRHFSYIYISDYFVLHILEHLGWERACGIEVLCPVWRSVIHRWFSQLRTLEFYNYRASDTVMCSILLKCRNLRSLTIVRNRDDLVGTDYLLTDTSVQTATESCKRLEHFHLEVGRTSLSLTSKSFEMIATNCPQLKSLTVKNCTCFEPNVFLQVVKFCRHLRTIKLTHTCEEKFVVDFAMQCSRDVRSLHFNFAGVPNARRSFLLHLLLKSCPKLDALTYSGVERDMLEAIMLHSTQWRKLELQLRGTATRELGSLFHRHCNLQELSLRCETLRGECICALGQSCKNLTKLSLYSTTESLVLALQVMAGNFSNIRCLRLIVNGNHEEVLLSTDSLQMVCPHIQNLTLHGFSMDSLLDLIGTLPHLQTLNFVGRLTKRREQRHEECPGPHGLRELNVHFRNIILDQHDFHNVVMRLPKLEVFSAEVGIDNNERCAALALLDQRCPFLRSVYIPGMINSASITLFHKGFRSLQEVDMGYIDINEYRYVQEDLRFRRPLLQVIGFTMF